MYKNVVASVYSVLIIVPHKSTLSVETLHILVPKSVLQNKKYKKSIKKLN